jgi:hypothetical protein
MRKTKISNYDVPQELKLPPLIDHTQVLGVAILCCLLPRILIIGVDAIDI